MQLWVDDMGEVKHQNKSDQPTKSQMMDDK